jgi:WD40 repeat protein
MFQIAQRLSEMSKSKGRRHMLSPDRKTVVSGSDDGLVRLWNVNTGKVIGRWMGHTDRVRPICWSLDGQQVLSGSNDGTARQWDAENGKTTKMHIHGTFLR